MRIESKLSGAVLVLAVHAPRVDSGVVPQFLQTASSAVLGASRVVLDLTDVNFLDSSGLGAVVGLRKALGADATLSVAGAQPAVATLFRLTRLDRVFRLFATSTEAIAALEPQ